MRSDTDVFKIEQVEAYKQKKARGEVNAQPPYPATYLNYPDETINAFRDLIQNQAPQILGAEYTNPYTGQKEKFPNKVDDFNAIHLQILARNQAVNTKGKTTEEKSNELYPGIPKNVRESVIEQLHFLVSTTTISSTVTVLRKGGYPDMIGDKRNARKKIDDAPYSMILVDQSGIQFQESLRNNGCAFFYPDDPKDSKLPADYADYQNKMYKAAYGKERPTSCSDDYIEVTWLGVKGRVDMNAITGYGFGIQAEFARFLKAGVETANNTPPDDDNYNLRYLKAGLGFFNDQIISKSGTGVPMIPKGKQNQIRMENARLQGILNHLQWIGSLPADKKKAELGKIKSLDLPFSNMIKGAAPTPETTIALLKKIEEQVKKLGLTYNGDGVIDALQATPGSKNISNNTGDSKTSLGNEGGTGDEAANGIVYGSVDAMIYGNTESDHMITGINPNMILKAEHVVSDVNAASVVKEMIGDKDSGILFKSVTDGILAYLNNKRLSAHDNDDNFKRANFYYAELIKKENSFCYKEIVLYALLHSQNDAALQTVIIDTINTNMKLSNSSKVNKGSLLMDLAEKLDQRCQDAAFGDPVKEKEYKNVYNKAATEITTEVNDHGSLSTLSKHHLQHVERNLSTTADTKKLGADIISELSQMPTISAAATHKHNGLEKIINISKDQNSKTKISDIMKECHYRVSTLSITSHFGLPSMIEDLLHGRDSIVHKRDPRVNLLYTAIANLEANRAFNNNISTLQHLIIAEQKRQVLEKFKDELIRSPNKAEHFKLIIYSLITSAPNETVSDVLGRSELKDAQKSLGEKQGFFFEATAKKNLEKLEQSVLMQQPSEILKQLQTKKVEVPNIRPTEKP